MKQKNWYKQAVVMHFFNAFALLHSFLPWILIRCVLLCMKVDRFQRILEYLGLMRRSLFLACVGFTYAKCWPFSMRTNSRKSEGNQKLVTMVRLEWLCAWLIHSYWEALFTVKKINESQLCHLLGEVPWLSSYTQTTHACYIHRRTSAIMGATLMHPCIYFLVAFCLNLFWLL